MQNDLLKETIEVTNSDLVIPTHANHYGTIFGGRVLELMDLTGAMAAMRFANEDVVTASMDAVDFRKPIKVGDMVELKAKVIHTARTSMVVKVDLYRVGKFSSQMDFSCRGYLVFVAITSDGEPREVPTLKVLTDEDKKNWGIGEKIKQRAKERRVRDSEEY
ncbi:MAG: acyl-CoA thioesterase [Candidatus Dadabacteria bacterium]|nr:acyl-CoA thioesterase [Candidatus Dadabacteria bacterium]MCZ6556074.1 acyl-CoA thioesterase [Candidatus Dadabacteria bacterium]MCZ6639134.1 acyl-CoA thioesterase [Candidatus Dadabacteria bacterium]MCZ6685854.1 acyl-CoA thioesterase [Candidatus Dadabacteria bacterium]MCZ6790740.1 acyl-CoA thioesterase [Candidatus Dadabacteria bacterium]